MTNSMAELVGSGALSSCLRGLDFAAALGMLARRSDSFLLTDDFDYELPEGQIATHPAQARDASRLFILNKNDGGHNHCFFRELPHLLRRRSLVVLNDTRVIPARLHAHKPTGGRVEVFLVERLATPASVEPDRVGSRRALLAADQRGRVWEPSQGSHDSWAEQWQVLLRGMGRCAPGSRLRFAAPLDAEVVERRERGIAVLRFSGQGQGGLLAVVEAVGEMPLPPYIEAARRKHPGLPPVDDRERYQTVFARQPGAVAAPTAGLHFTAGLLAEIEAAGHEIAHLTLHVGPGTFRPVTTSDPAQHRLDAERFEVGERAAASLRRAQAEGRPIVAVGTTVVRSLETLGRRGPIAAATGSTDLLILPGDEFRVVTDLITNFHLPKSSLLMLVSAFAGRERVLSAYREAIVRGYRFYSYGDAMFIRPEDVPS
jgi:S-adenosylmethionine:tRNA ribosyltransferase-isomerase